MNQLLRAIIILSLAVTAKVSVAFDQQAKQNHSDSYVRLLKASKFVENYQEMASLLMRVLDASGRANERASVPFWRVVSRADLSDTMGCLTDIYKSHGITATDAAELVTIFESPLGSKVLALSQRRLLANIERGSSEDPSPDLLSEEEKQEIRSLSRNAAYNKYREMVIGQGFGASSAKCVLESKAVKDSGIKF